jgi:hypothetical protein
MSGDNLTGFEEHETSINKSIVVVALKTVSRHDETLIC